MEEDNKQNITLAEIKKDIEHLCESVQRMEKCSKKKVDKEMYDLYLKSQTRRTSEVDAKVDRLWDELVEKKEKDEEFQRELSEEMAKFKTIQAVKMSRLSQVVFVIGIGATLLAQKIWGFIFS